MISLTRLKRCRLVEAGRIITLFSFLFLIIDHRVFSQVYRSEANVIMNIPGYPTVFELDPGEEYVVVRTLPGDTVKRRIKLISVTPTFRPDFWTNKEGKRTNIYTAAAVVVEIDGRRSTLVRRPYEMPVEYEGLRLYVEGIKPWASSAQFEGLKNMKKLVRLSVCAAGEPWGPPSLIYPIRSYRWRSSSYNNTWSSLVPYNLLYYHRGEDRSAIPDRLEVVEPITGKVVGTPVPHGDGASNGVIVQNQQRIYVRISHMDIENINPGLSLGVQVEKGTLIGNTGMTWSGRRSQKRDPHCHIEMGYYAPRDTFRLSAFPYLIEAYFRSYPDPVLAVAGGYAFTVPGKPVELDGSRSMARPGRHIRSYSWILHNGEKVEGAHATLKYDTPGLYTEELVVTTDQGALDRDFLQVRVWNPDHGRDIAYGWVFQYPVRGVKVNDPVMFWNRLAHTEEPVTIDFGDGSPLLTMDEEVAHPYRQTGRYVVTFSSYGPRHEPITEKLEVVVGGSNDLSGDAH